MALRFELRGIHFAEKEDRKILLACLVESERTFQDGNLVVKRMVTTVLYTEVEEYKPFINYHHARNEVEYTSEERAGFIAIPVYRFPDEVVEEVIKLL